MCPVGLAKRTARRLVGIGFAVCRPEKIQLAALTTCGVMGFSLVEKKMVPLKKWRFFFVVERQDRDEDESFSN